MEASFAMHQILATCAMLVCLAEPDGTGKSAKDTEAQIRAQLKPLGKLVGTWKGTATPLDRESKRKRAFWKETSSWRWAITKDRVGLVWTVADGKRIKEGFLTFDPAAKQFVMKLQTADGKSLHLRGVLQDGTLDLTAADSKGGAPRLSLSIVGDNRFLYSIHDRTAAGGYIEMLKTGNTREGVQFAGKSAGPECIVTGGAGTITVSYQGKTYYVCCSGCKEAFDAEPEKYITEAKAKRKNK